MMHQGETSSTLKGFSAWFAQELITTKTTNKQKIRLGFFIGFYATVFYDNEPSLNIGEGEENAKELLGSRGFLPIVMKPLFRSDAIDFQKP
jgi:hypothetical protein